MNAKSAPGPSRHVRSGMSVQSRRAEAPWNAYDDFVGPKTSEGERKRERKREKDRRKREEEIAMVS